RAGALWVVLRKPARLSGQQLTVKRYGRLELLHPHMQISTSGKAVERMRVVRTELVPAARQPLATHRFGLVQPMRIAVVDRKANGPLDDIGMIVTELSPRQTKCLLK